MQRKDFIRTAFLGLSAIPFYSLGKNIQLGNSPKIIIIGAGIAGAAAARKLVDTGFDVTILEARNRIGGRIHTNNDLGCNIELGANWIHDSKNPKNPLKPIADLLKIENQETRYTDLKLYDRNGDKISKLRLGIFYNHLENEISRKVEQLNFSQTDVSIQKIIDQIISENNYSQRELDMISFVSKTFSTSVGADLDEASSRYNLNNSSGKRSEDYFILGGYRRIVDDLLTEIDIKLETVVREIRHDATNVKVVTDKQIFEADYVIVTVPISILQKKQIQFSPELPEWKVNSFSKMQMGLFNKVVMEFTEKFWDGNSDFQCYNTDQANSSGISVNYHHYNQKNILIALPVGKAGLWVEENDFETIKKEYQGILHKAHKGKEIEFKNIMKTSWNSDDFSQGSYSHIPVGTTENDFKTFEREVGRIHFAGEATNGEQHATVHGAYNSGIREALKIINAQK
jgi:polyamine oxidase